MAFPSKHAVKAPGALVRAGVETSSDRVRELATDEMLTVEEVKWSSKGVARARISSPEQGWLSCKCVVGGEMLAGAVPAPAPKPAPKPAAAAAARPAAPKPSKAKVPPPSDDGIAAAEAVRTKTSEESDVVSIGTVKLRLPSSYDEAFVPSPPPLRGRGLDLSREAARTLQWMMQKCRLKQDMFLLADAGPRARQLALAFCHYAKREVEYVCLTRDTNESDLKQRREIVDGDLDWANQPPVEAALKGRVLILEGVEKAERNVLPLLNNLLENREMALEDGTFLTPRAGDGDGLQQPGRPLREPRRGHAPAGLPVPGRGAGRVGHHPHPAGPQREAGPRLQTVHPPRRRGGLRRL